MGVERKTPKRESNGGRKTQRAGEVKMGPGDGATKALIMKR